jgi:hypothetical protein
MLSLIYPIASFFYVYGKLDRGEFVSVSAFINLFASCIIAFFIIYAWLNSNKFKKIEALEITKNRELIASLIHKHKWIERRKTKTLIITSPPADLFSFNWGRQFNFLLDKQYIYINVTSFGRFDVSPFHYFADRHKEMSIKKEIKGFIRNDQLAQE